MKKHFVKLSLQSKHLKVVANLLPGGKHSVDKVEQIPWSNNEHWMYHYISRISQLG